MTIATFKRYESKFLISEVQFKSIYPILLEHMYLDKNCRDGQEYTINNIYYDNEFSSIIRHSKSKPYYKEKLRLRSYGINNSPNSKVFLELKKKINGMVTKRRAVLSLAEANDFLEHGIYPHCMDYINSQVLNEIAYFLKNNDVIPAAYISYDRIALISHEDKDFRVTFDHNIITRREEIKLEKGRFGEELLGSDKYLMEVKVSAAFPMWLANLLSSNQIYRTSFSKYGQEYKRFLIQSKMDSTIPQYVH